MSAIAVVGHLRELAADPINRATIVKDQGCLSGLVLFLDNEDKEVVLKALEALNFLADYAPNRPIMKDEMGMAVSLKTIVNNEGLDIQLRKLAKQVYHKIIPKPQNRAPSSATKAGKKTNPFFLGTSNKKAKLVILQIRGLTTATRRVCEENMVRKKGVISFTFDMGRSRMVVRCKHDLTPESLCETINQTKLLSAQQVVKNEKGEETMLSFGTAPSGSDKGNCSQPLPDYLPEEDFEETSDKVFQLQQKQYFIKKPKQSFSEFSRTIFVARAWLFLASFAAIILSLS